MERAREARLKRAAAKIRSGAERYPRALWRSIRGQGEDQDPARLAERFEQVMSEPLAAAWIGHATVLLHLGGRWILTDPVFSHRIGVSLGGVTLGLERLGPPAMALEDLPELDLILISHAHFDHLDRPSLRRLASARTMVVTSTSTRGLIPSGFGAVRELAWGERLDVFGLRISAIEPAHWGARTGWDRHRGFNAYVLEGGGKRVFYAGDTAFTEDFRSIGGSDLCVFGIGAYDPWIDMHANPEQVWRMHEQAEGGYLLPMHYRTFKLSREPLDEPLRRLRSAARSGSERIVGTTGGELWVPGTRARG